MGLPGVGRGTQTEETINIYGTPHTSTGDTFRVAMQNETTLGPEAKSHVDRGMLVSGEVANGIVEEQLTKPNTGEGFLLDSFPCTLDQVKALDAMLKGLSKKIDAVIDIHIGEKISVERLADRFIYSSCGAAYHKIFDPTKVENTYDRYGGHEFYQREDDEPETVESRLVIDIKSGESILTYYKE